MNISPYALNSIWGTFLSVHFYFPYSSSPYISSLWSTASLFMKAPYLFQRLSNVSSSHFPQYPEHPSVVPSIKL